ncbi:MAG: serine/threonine protein kinase [Leptospiraceae bacterium]|nr:serine/threonine protein kinase [Leptospiraceae bacterium]
MNAATARVGKYTIHRLIAQGGMGKIYKARHPTLKRDIILKRLNVTGNRTIDRRFLREARLMMDFRHDHIVQVYDHFKEGPFYYIAMEYIDGISLADLIDKHRYLRNDVALLIFYEICKALKYAHDRGVIHRDIKPENILISRRGEVKLTDFGIARADDSRLEGLTRNMTLGTPAYMSPEQLENSSRVDCRSDIYSLGVVLYRMVTGRCPFPGNITPETITLITMGRYRPPQKINPEISGFIRRVIRRAMHRMPQKRYANLNQLIGKLEKKLGRQTDAGYIRDVLRNYIRGQKLPARPSLFNFYRIKKTTGGTPHERR